MLLSHPSPAGQRPVGLSIRPNQASPQAKNLIAWWPLAAPQKKVFDAAWGRYPSVGVTPEAGWVSAPSPGGWAARFDGSAYWNWGDQAAFDFGSDAIFAISCWAWFTGATPSLQICKREILDTGYDLLYAPNAVSGELRARVQVDVSAVASADATGLDDGNYHHVLFGYDGANTVLIVDGGRFSSFVSNPNVSGVSNTTAFQLGARAGTAIWTGRMFDVRVYLRAPTLSLASQMYNPATRWQLYQVPSRRYWLDAPAAAPAGGRIWKLAGYGGGLVGDARGLVA